tara:strand:+ start:1643 stop:2122 length:480 start_codon:yes stop_codon:yes gene_type:complete
MLSNTEKVLSVIVLFIALAVGYSLIQYNAAMAEMERLQEDREQHVDQVNTEFRTRVKNVELDNVGQGKKIAEGREMILENTALINAKADSLGNLIDDLAYEIKKVERDLSKKIKNVERDLEGLEDNFDKEKRKTRRDISDLKKSVKKLNDEVFPPEDKK